jgi:ParB-like chromosome segregation protein Spo0J
MKYNPHPACEAWPVMSDDELQKLTDDIKLNGLLDPITLAPDGMLLDGRARALACEALGIEPTTTVYSDDPVNFSIAKNMRRRHLTKAELAFVAETLARIKHGGDRRSQNFKISARDLEMTDVARQLGLGHAIVADARSLNEHAADNVIAMAKSGKVGMRAAAAYARNTPKAQQATATAKQIIQKGGSINKGQEKGKKAVRKATSKPSKRAVTIPYLGGLPPMRKEDSEKLDWFRQKVHLHTVEAKQMVEAQELVVATLAAALKASGPEVPDAPTLAHAIDSLLAWVVDVERSYGHDIDYAANTRKKLRTMIKCIGPAIARLTEIRDMIAQRYPDIVATVTEDRHGKKIA